MQQAGGGDGCAAANNTSKFTDRRSNQQQETTTGNSKLGHEASRVTRHNTNSPHNRTGYVVFNFSLIIVYFLL